MGTKQGGQCPCSQELVCKEPDRKYFGFASDTAILSQLLNLPFSERSRQRMINFNYKTCQTAFLAIACQPQSQSLYFMEAGRPKSPGTRIKL